LTQGPNSLDSSRIQAPLEAICPVYETGDSLVAGGLVASTQGGYMAKHRNREEAVNTQLAVLISRYGITADGETIHFHGKHRPDVLFQMRGLRVVIEGKFADHPKAEDVVLGDARRRVRSGMAHIAAAAVYPAPLRTTPTTKIINALERSQLKYRIVSETNETEDWFEGSPASLMDALRRAQEGLTKDDIVEQTAKSLSN
jgi:hypothetical protein